MIQRFWLLPWWVISLATGAKAFSDNPLIGSPALNRWGLHALRVRLAHRLAARRRARLARSVRSDDRAAFDRDGFVVVPDFLPPAQFAALQAETAAFRGPAREMVQGDTITRRLALDPAALRAIPAAASLLRNVRWRGLIRYAGSADAEPITYIQTILPRRHDAPPDPQTALHADTFHPTVKAWLFLDDVAEEDGPLTYVPGSHRLTPQRLAWERARSLVARTGLDRLSSRGSLRIEPEELAALGLPPPVRFAVPANTLVVADTVGFHARGLATRPSTRVEIWAYGRRNPFLPWTGFDPLGLPGIAERRIPLYWAMRDRLHRLWPHAWRKAGLKRAADP